MDEYELHRQYIINELTELKKDIANGIADRVEVARANFLEQLLKGEYEIGEEEEPDEE